MDTDYWKRSPFGEESIFHPSWEEKREQEKQTVEFRCPDGSADIYLLLAGLVVAARHGFEMEGALEFAKKTYVDVDIHRPENKQLVESLAQLPASCWESADELSSHRAIFEAHGVFNREMIDDIVKQLKSYKDQNIRKLQCDGYLRCQRYHLADGCCFLPLQQPGCLHGYGQPGLLHLLCDG